MQKYKITASKNQKKYTLVVSADSATHAKEKIHKDGYSVLSVSELSLGEVSGKKFLFQVEKDGEIKSGAIIGDDIFKVYVKLRNDLGYNILFLFPEGDDAQNSQQKRQEILEKLEIGFELKSQEKKEEKEVKEKDQNFYIQKKLSQTSSLIEKVIKKIEYLLLGTSGISEEKRQKLSAIYEKLIHIKGTSNINKLQEVGEIALEKIAEIELEIVEKDRNKESRDLLSETNDLLKKMGSSKHFREADKDYKKKVQLFFEELQKNFSFESFKENLKGGRKVKRSVDTHSYSYLKTVLLLNTYKKKLIESRKEVWKKPSLYLNPFVSSEEKEKFYIKRKVIQQNISLLQAKKSGRISSYTTAKKGIGKIIEGVYSLGEYTGINFYSGIIVFVFLFLIFTLFTSLGIFNYTLSPSSIRYIIPIFLLYIIFHMMRHQFVSGLGIFTLLFLFLFIQINF